MFGNEKFMLKKTLIIVLLGSINVFGLPLSLNEYPFVCFTPNKKCQSHIVDHINDAKKSIRLQAFSFTDKVIANALVEAHKRGVDVKLILDKSNVNNSQSAKDIVIEAGIAVRFDYPSGIAHNKIIIIDEGTLITGSYNFSENAYKNNTENLLILVEPSLCKSYIENWNIRWEQSK
jgi:phosphatidylserine/phosphatidylglycerophosphate/cardiolipin synthase-like enzyme